VWRLLLQTEHRKRERARKAAVKPAVEYDEDGHVKVSVGVFEATFYVCSAGAIAGCLGAWGLSPRLLSQCTAELLPPPPPSAAQCLWPLLQGMLSKYDDEEEDAGFQIRAGAVVADDKARQAAEERRKLAESACGNTTYLLHVSCPLLFRCPAHCWAPALRHTCHPAVRG
jgi:hypothetical protein